MAGIGGIPVLKAGFTAAFSFCAYDIEKRLNKRDGVSTLEVESGARRG